MEHIMRSPGGSAATRRAPGGAVPITVGARLVANPINWGRETPGISRDKLRATKQRVPMGLWNGFRFDGRGGRSVGVVVSAAAEREVGSEGTAYPSSIKHYIAQSCPAPGLDGRFREQPLAYTLQYPLIRASGLAALPTPGSWTNVFVSSGQLSEIKAHDGKVVVAVLEDGENGNLRPLAPRSDSYACLARTCGDPVGVAGQEGWAVQLHAQQRVAIQAIDMESGSVQAAELTDRWIYFVRAGAVEELAAADGTLDGAGREVMTALRDIVDAGEELQRTIDDVKVLHGQLSGVPINPWEEVLKWAENVRSLEQQVPSKQERLLITERLSYGAFQEGSQTEGDELDVLVAMRQKAMETTDLGMRVEDALTYASRVLKRLRAEAALMQL